jgi:hypothetical protein
MPDTAHHQAAVLWERCNSGASLIEGLPGLQLENVTRSTVCPLSNFTAGSSWRAAHASNKYNMHLRMIGKKEAYMLTPPHMLPWVFSLSL